MTHPCEQPPSKTLFKYICKLSYIVSIQGTRGKTAQATLIPPNFLTLMKYQTMCLYVYMYIMYVYVYARVDSMNVYVYL